MKAIEKQLEEFEYPAKTDFSKNLIPISKFD
jgi:hypothetical protein